MINPLLLLSSAINCSNEIMNGEYLSINMSCDVNISSCIFFRTIVYNGNGGILCITDYKYDVVIYDCQFFECKASGIGGAIYMDKEIGYEFKRICGNRCSASDSHFMFCMFYKTYGSIIEQMSISCCSENYFGHSVCTFRCYSTSVYSANLSKNSANTIGSLYFKGVKEILLSRSNFYNNSAISQCIRVETRFANLNGCNIIGNEDHSIFAVFTAFFDDFVSISYFMIFENNGRLFYSGKPSLRIFNSFILHHGGFSTTNITLYENKYEYKPTYSVEPQKCIEFNDSNPSQTVDSKYQNINPLIIYGIFFILFGISIALFLIFRFQNQLQMKIILSQSLTNDFG